MESLQTFERVFEKMANNKHIFEENSNSTQKKSNIRLDNRTNRIYLRNKSSHRALPAECPGEGFLTTTQAEAPMTTNITPIRHMVSNAMAPATPQTRLRLTARGRRLLIALVVIPTVLALLWAMFTGGGANATNTTFGSTLTYITVDTDDDLWQIAQREAPQADTRDYVDALISLNHLTGEIQPGQRLALPTGF
jgi:hypothetical protein